MSFYLNRNAQMLLYHVTTKESATELLMDGFDMDGILQQNFDCPKGLYLWPTLQRAKEWIEQISYGPAVILSVDCSEVDLYPDSHPHPRYRQAAVVFDPVKAQRFALLCEHQSKPPTSTVS